MWKQVDQLSQIEQINAGQVEPIQSINNQPHMFQQLNQNIAYDQTSGKTYFAKKLNENVFMVEEV